MAPTRPGSSQYLRHLPALFSEDPFLGQFLRAFEEVLGSVGGDDAEPKYGLEGTIADLATLFDPLRTPDGFLPWLAGWVALSLEADWGPQQQREFLGRIVALYRRRGTEENLKELVRIYTGSDPQIREGEQSGFQIGAHSTIGQDSQLGGSVPHFFHITVSMAPDPARARRHKEIITALVDLEKPAHTFYKLDISFATMQIGKTSTIGVNTLLGNLSETTS